MVNIGEQINNVYNFFTPTNDSIDNVIYTINNWHSLYQEINSMKAFFQNANDLLVIILDRNGALWLNANGDLCYRFSKDTEIHTTSFEKASILFSNFLRRDIQIGKNRKSTKTNTIFMPIHQLLLIEKETFDFNQSKEFYQSKNGLIYRNTFKPSPYLLQQAYLDQRFKPSIISQYIFYLSNYNESRFYVILHWLANFFKNFKYKTSIPLILIGDKNSGVDILFNQIITPLFGHEYCASLTDENLPSSNFSTVLKNKLMYNLDNIFNSIDHKHESKKILSTMIQKQKVFLKDHKDTNELEIFGQILITINKPYISYLDTQNTDCIVFKVPNDFEEQMIISSQYMKIEPFMADIANDLENFANILKNCSINHDVFQKALNEDDKRLLQQTLDDKIKVFHNAIKNMDITYFEKIKNINPYLYKDITQDFEARRIKQPNLLPCFEYIYGKDDNLTSRTLMSALRKINPTFYSTKTMGIGAGGIKYFKCQNCQIGADFISLHK